MSACTQKAANLRFFHPKRCLTNTPRRRHTADGQLSALHPTSPDFGSFGAACVMCCFPPASSSPPLRAFVYYASISLVVNIMFIRTFYDYLHVRYIFDHNCSILKSLLIVFLQSLPLTPWRYCQAGGQLSSLHSPSPSFSSFGPACVKLCCLPPPSLVRNTRLCCLVYV